MLWECLAESHGTVTYILLAMRWDELRLPGRKSLYCHLPPVHHSKIQWDCNIRNHCTISQTVYRMKLPSWSTAPSLTVCWLWDKMLRLSSTTSFHYHSHTVKHVIQYILWLKGIQVYSHSIGNETKAFFRKQFQWHGTHSLLRMIKCNEILGSTKCNIAHSLLFVKHAMSSIDHSSLHSLSVSEKYDDVRLSGGNYCIVTHFLQFIRSELIKCHNNLDVTCPLVFIFDVRLGSRTDIKATHR